MHIFQMIATQWYIKLGHFLVRLMIPLRYRHISFTEGAINVLQYFVRTLRRGAKSIRFQHETFNHWWRCWNINHRWTRAELIENKYDVILIICEMWISERHWSMRCFRRKRSDWQSRTWRNVKSTSFCWSCKFYLKYNVVV